MGEPVLLGLDCSTQSSTACAFTPSGRLLARASVPRAVRVPREGWAEQSPAGWSAGAVLALRRAARLIGRRSVAAIGVAFQRETFSLAGRDGRFLMPGILWLDTRASGEAAALARGRAATSFRRLTGKALDATCAGPRLAWMARHEPGLLSHSACFVDVGAALSLALAGRFVTCVSGADTCGLVGLRNRKWLPELLPGKARHLRFPELVEPGAVLGPLTDGAARATGLARGIPVVAAGGDGQVFALGAGADRPGRGSLGLGTSVVLGLLTGRPVTSPAFRTLLLGPGAYLLEGVLQSGTWLLRWFTGAFGRPGLEDEAAWDAAAARIPPGSAGLRTIPHWRGVRFPESRPDARGIVAGWSDRHTAAHFYRSLLEGTAFELKRLMAAMEADCPGRTERALRAGGGGMSSRIWPRMLAEVLGRPLVPAAGDATALGAAMWAASGAGLFGSVRESCAAMARNRPVIRPSAAGRRLYSSLYREWQSVRRGSDPDN